MPSNSKLCRLAALLLLSMAVGCQAQKWVAVLDGADQMPPLSETELGGAMGTFTLWVNPDGELEYSVEASSITNLTMGHIHIGNSTTAGPVAAVLIPVGGEVVDGAPPMLDPPLSGSYAASGVPLSIIADLTVSEFLDLADSEGLYANLHTTAYPNGAIRGQLTPVPDLIYTAELDGANQVPANDETATASFTLTTTAEGYDYSLDIKGISNLTMGHIHIGNATTSGDVAVILVPVGGMIMDGAPPVLAAPESGDLTFSGSFTDADILTITPEEFKQYLRFPSENFYVNLHTTAYPGGVIRAQLMYTYEEEAAAPAPAMEEPAMMTPAPAPAPTGAASTLSKTAGVLVAALVAALMF